ncbi:MAG: hypothetical protein HC820_02330 [Hydrococcus sp. RM1_1_31]|nr:hypothetical protein [Hydrococcus sp. RM1_1_31]
MQKQADKKEKQLIEIQYQLDKQEKNYQTLQQKMETKDRKISELERKLEQQTLQGDEQARIAQTLQEKTNQSDREIVRLQNQLEQLTRQIDEQRQTYREEIIDLQKQIAQQDSLAAIATSHLNKWRKHHFLVKGVTSFLADFFFTLFPVNYQISY